MRCLKRVSPRGAWLAFGLAFAVLGPVAPGWSQQAKPETIDPRLNPRQDKFMDALAEARLDAATESLLRFPPAVPEPRERRLALFLIDGVLHDVYAPHRAAVQEFFKMRMDEALNEIEATEIEEGAVIWKLYNHGFIVKTATVAIGFDLTGGGSVRVDEFMPFHDFERRLVEICDALFISHRHRDHADLKLAGMMIEAGKPVVAPPEVWRGEKIHGRLTHLKRERDLEQKLAIQEGKRELRVVVFPGHQGRNIENNVPLVFTPEGMSFAQTGDQSNDEDFAWIDEVGEKFRVDVLMPNCWTNDIVRMAKGFDPELVITGHENELGHTIDHREPYFLTYQRLRRSTYPLVLMTWGESYRYHPKGEAEAGGAGR